MGRTNVLLRTTSADEARATMLSEVTRLYVDRYRGRPGLMDRQRFLTMVEAAGQDPGRFLFLPEDVDRNPGGYCVIARLDDGWEAYVDDRGKRDLRGFDTESGALEYAFRRWVLRKDA